MKRRDFFRFGVKKAAGLAYEAASAKATQRAQKWFRPPYAVDEMAFVLDCTRCDKCIETCEFDVLMKLPAGHGPRTADTPVMDLLVHGCHMCDGWPCVTVCEPGVLKLPVMSVPDDVPDDVLDDGNEDPEGEVAVENPPPPKLAVAKINEATCLPYSGPECGACASSCPVPGALEWQAGGKPVINQKICTGCAMCREACIIEPSAVIIGPHIVTENTPEET